MDNKNTENIFKYTYSAEEQDEIKRIRQKYQPMEENGMARLRKLDSKVTQKATSIALILGVFGALIMGAGMSLVLTDLGALLGMQELFGMIFGIIVGLVGIILIVLAYPLYNIVLKKEREKIAPEIFKLTEELMR